MLPKILIASNNSHKIKEISHMLGDAILLLSLNDFPEIGDIEETGSTFEENALIKARTTFQHCNMLTVSDDSGLEVDFLNGAPGVYSARYAGEAKNDAANNQKLLKSLKGVPEQQRGAQFRCVVAIVAQGIEKIVEGIVRGKIAEKPEGSGGFGYDPLFIPEGYDHSFGKFDPALKHKISHRGQAFKKAKLVIEEILADNSNN